MFAAVLSTATKRGDASAILAGENNRTWPSHTRDCSALRTLLNEKARHKGTSPA